MAGRSCLGVRGLKDPVAAIADEDGARCTAGLRSYEDRVGQEASCLDPARGDNDVPDER